MVFQNDILAGASGSVTTYSIDQSIRFNSADSSYLTKTFGADGGDTWTFSLWIKKGKITSGGNWYFFSEAGGSGIGFVDSSDKLRFYNASAIVDSTQVFRDVGGWYHFVFSNNAGTVTITVNNTAVEIGATTATLFNRNNAWSIGRYYDNTNFFDGYMAEMNFVDGQALSPTDFGETNDSGVWVPKAVTGTYGTNGFYITGEDSAALGTDYSGNGNDFTSSGLAAADQVIDTPTNNFPTFSPINLDGVTLTDGNLKCNAAAWYSGAAATMSLPTSGKWYIETLVGSRYGTYQAQGFIPNDGSLITNAAQAIYLGAQDNASSPNYGLGMLSGSNVFGFYAASGTTTATVTEPDGSTLASTNEIYICHAIDLDNERYFVGTAFTTDTSVTWFGPAGSGADPATPSEGLDISAYLASYGSYGLTFFHAPNTASGGNPYATVDFGQSGFTFTKPTSFSALSTANLPTPTITDGSANFQTTLYTGNGTAIGSGGLAVSQIENSTFQPDFVWIKGRSGATEHVLTDATRGVTKELSSNDTGAEETVAEGLTTFGSAGFTVGSDGSYNTNTATYAAWQWKAGTGAGSSNTDGSINTTTTSVNTAAGISISTYSGDGNTGATVGHGLGVKPAVVIIKPSNAADNWIVSDPSGDFANKLKLNDLEAASSAANFVNAASSTTFTFGSDINVNGSGRTFVAYCFAEIDGFSKFGVYTGNGSADGAFVWCGFKPAWILIKCTNNGEYWHMFDSTRDPYNVTEKYLYADEAQAETTYSLKKLDLLSNGVKLRGTDGGMNGSGKTYAFYAFAEHPFGGEDVAPATAR